MEVRVEEFSSGWRGLAVGLTDEDIVRLIERLTVLRESKGHFHARSNFEGPVGIGDIEFFWAESSSTNLRIE